MKNITLKKENGICYLCFDRPEASVNLLDKKVLLELDSLLSEVESKRNIKGIIIHSSKPNIFIAGADIKKLAPAKINEIENLIKLGQGVFDHLASMPVPTVAAIHGACAGGGYELALACDWRVASDSSASKIGLPETQLGLLPAWGGSTRLPRLVGLNKAVQFILAGKLHHAKAAQLLGLVDAIAPQEKVLELAATYLKKGKRPRSKHLVSNNRVAAHYIRRKIGQQLFQKNLYQYPALQLAADTLCKSVSSTHEQSLKRECEAFTKLVQLPETRELLRLFFLTEQQKKLPISKKSKSSFQDIVVIGAGVMGAGIAYWCATKKYQVTLKDINAKAVAKGMQQIEKIASAAKTRNLITSVQQRDSLDRIFPTYQNVNLSRSRLVIEAAVEDLEVKKKIFQELTESTGPNCILATNTSALPITELARSNPVPERVIGLHFFNPVHRMKLVEVVKTEFISEEVLADTVKFVQSIGKLAVIVKDSPGFLVNRILLPYLVRAGEFFTEGSSPIDLDKRMLQFGMPMGPLRLLDEIGLDVALNVARTLSSAFPERMKVPHILQQLVDAGCLGRKNGHGFYLYRKGQKTVVENPVAVGFQKSHCSIPETAEEELIHALSHEALLCLKEGIAESADEIDFAMVMGTGYAPFRGGPIQYHHKNSLEFTKSPALQIQPA